MSNDRLFRMLYYLLNKGRATASELAEKLEVSVRTIYRDIDTLSGAGIPVYAEPGRKGGVRLLDGYLLQQAAFSEDEKRDMLAAIQGLSALRDAGEQEILQKLSALFQTKAEPWLEVDFSRWGSQAQDAAVFALLKGAILHHNVITITYVGTSGRQEDRAVQPTKLLYKFGGWYLRAYCRKRLAFRLFKLSRILSAAPTGESFTPEEEPTEEESPEKRYQEIRLRFAPSVAYRVYDEFTVSQIQKSEDGSLIACAELPEDAWLVGYLLSFGTQVEVLEPAHLRGVLAEQAKKIWEHNKP